MAEEQDTVPQPPAGGTTQESETIEGLVFVPNPDYPYPFKVPRAPHFWMEEQTGVLEDAVESYMEGERVTSSQLRVLKIYLTQFIERAPLAGDAKVPLLLQRLDRLKTTREVEEFADELAEYGVEVF